jgi:DNA-binding transcriptional LysR family regulator
MLEDLKAFVEAVERRSLTKAATRLGLTQSAVSRRIQHLEALLGGTLFDRAQKPPLPTPLGHRVYTQAVSIVASLETLLSMVREDSVPSGLFKLGVAQAVGDAISPRIVELMTTRFAALDLRLRTDTSDGLAKQTIGGELDAALVLTPAGTPLKGVVGTLVSSLDLVVVQSRSEPRFLKPVVLRSLADEPWILNPQGCGYRSALAEAMGRIAKDVRVLIDVYGSEVQLRMVGAGLGLGLVPRNVLNASPSRNAIRVVDVRDLSLSLDLWLISRREIGGLKSALDEIISVSADMFGQPNVAPLAQSLVAKPLQKRSSKKRRRT